MEWLHFGWFLVVSSRFGDQPKTHPLPLPRDFSAPFSAPKISPPTYLPPPTSLTSFPTHSISRVRKSSQAWNNIELWKRCETQGLRKVESSTLKECGEEKARGVLHPKCRSERRKVSSFPSLHFFLLYGFFFLFFYLRRRRCREKALETKGQK